jgi:hypothetical protein
LPEYAALELLLLYLAGEESNGFFGGGLTNFGKPL